MRGLNDRLGPDRENDARERHVNRVLKRSAERATAAELLLVVLRAPDPLWRVDLERLVGQQRRERERGRAVGPARERREQHDRLERAAGLTARLRHVIELAVRPVASADVREDR